MAGKNTLRGTMRTLSLVHAALVINVGMYLLILYFVTQNPKVPPPKSFEEVQMMFWMLGAVGIGTLAAIPFLRSQLMPPRRSAQQLDDGVGNRPRSKRARAAVGKLFMVSIGTWALAESVAIYGLILGFVMHELWPLYPFAAVSVVALMLCAPRRVVVEEVVRAADAGD